MAGYRNLSATVSALNVLSKILIDTERKQTLDYYETYWPDAEYLHYLVTVAVEYERYDSVDRVLERLGCPSDLSVQEKLSYYALVLKGDDK